MNHVNFIFRLRRIVILHLLFWFGVVSYPSAVVASGDGMRSVRFMLWAQGYDLTALFEIGPDDRFPDGLSLWLWLGGKETEEVVIPFNVFSGPVALRGMEEVTLYQRAFNLDAPEDVPPLASRILIPAGQRHSLVILVPDGDLADRRFNSFVLDDGQQHFPANSARLINLSRQPVEVALGDARFMVEGRGQSIVPLDTSNGSLRLIVAKTVAENGRPQVVSRNLRVYDGIRVTCFLFGQAEAGERLRLRLLTENVHLLNQE